MFRKVVSLVILSILMTGCGPSEAQAPTALPQPTIESSPTPIVLADIDLKSLVVQDGDLPVGVTLGQSTARLPNWYERNKGPETDAGIYITLAKGTEKAGEIVVVLTGDKETKTLAYQAFQRALGSEREDSTEVGEEAQTFDTYFQTPIYVIAFTRCSAIVYIDFKTYKNEALIYATNLDERLKATLCP